MKIKLQVTGSRLQVDSGAAVLRSERGLSQSAARRRPGRLEIGTGLRSGKVLRVETTRAPRETFNRRRAFSLVELLVAMTLLSLIVLVLMAVFGQTQTAFRSSVTQTDVLEGSRSAVEMITADLRNMAPSGGGSNWVSPVNFVVLDNDYGNSLYPTMPPLAYLPLQQTLPGTATQRTNVLNYFFMLGRENMKWTGVGYAVNTTNASPLYSLYRFYGETNLTSNPFFLYSNFVSTVYNQRWTNMSRVLDGVVHLTVRAYDRNGVWLTNGCGWNYTNRFGGPLRPQNVWFCFPAWGEVGGYFFSNAVPAAVELQMGVIEDRALQRAESFGSLTAASNYLAQQSGRVHVFRQRVTIPNVDPSAYQ